MLLTERESRRRVRDTRYAGYAERSVDFVRDVVGDFLWSKQREIIEAVGLYPKVAVPSCHGVGKSFIAARVVSWFVTISPPGEARAVITAPTGDQVRGILWQEIQAAHSRGHLPGKTSASEWHIDNFQVAVGRKPNDYAPTAFQGYHARRLLVVLDEACGIPENLWIAADSLATTAGSRQLAIGNPDDPTSHFAKICKPGSGWHVIPISVFDSPNFTGETVPEHIRDVLTSVAWVDDKRRIWGELSPLWASKVLGQFPEVGDDTLIPPGWIRQAQDRYAESEDGEPIELGCDIARFGTNETVLILRRGIRARVYQVLRQRDLMTVTGAIVRAIKDTGCSACKIDDTGLGGGVTDRLLELHGEGEFGLQNVDIIPINVGRSPTDHEDREARGESERFFDLKAELSWHIRSLFEQGEIALESDDEMLGQTAAIKYRLTSRGQLRIEGKDEMQKRGLPSPDRWDALVLAYAPQTSRSLRAWEAIWRQFT